MAFIRNFFGGGKKLDVPLEEKTWMRHADASAPSATNLLNFDTPSNFDSKGQKNKTGGFTITEMPEDDFKKILFQKKSQPVPPSNPQPQPPLFVPDPNYYSQPALSNPPPPATSPNASSAPPPPSAPTPPLSSLPSSINPTRSTRNTEKLSDGYDNIDIGDYEAMKRRIEQREYQNVFREERKPAVQAPNMVIFNQRQKNRLEDNNDFLSTPTDYIVPQKQRPLGKPKFTSKEDSQKGVSSLPLVPIVSKPQSKYRDLDIDSVTSLYEERLGQLRALEARHDQIISDNNNFYGIQYRTNEVKKQMDKISSEGFLQGEIDRSQATTAKLNAEYESINSKIDSITDTRNKEQHVRAINRLNQKYAELKGQSSSKSSQIEANYRGLAEKNFQNKMEEFKNGVPYEDFLLEKLELFVREFKSRNP